MEIVDKDEEDEEDEVVSRKDRPWSGGPRMGGSGVGGRGLVKKTSDVISKSTFSKMLKTTRNVVWGSL